MIFYIYVIIFAAFGSVFASMFGAFILGILVDLWRGNTLGTSSVIFVCLAFAIQLYKRKFNPQAPGFLLLAGMVTFVLSDVIASHGSIISWGRLVSALTVAVVVISLWFIILKIWVQPSEKGKIHR